MKRLPAFILLMLILFCLSACRRESPADPGPQNTIVQAGLFTAPSTDKGVLISAIPAGTTLDVLEVKDGWSRVEYNGTKGWVYSSFMEPGGTTASLVRAEAPTLPSEAETTAAPVELADVSGRAAVTFSNLRVVRFDTGETLPAPSPAATEPAPAPTTPPAQEITDPVHALSMEQLNDIAARFDGTVLGYGSGGTRDAVNCPDQIRRYQSQLAGYNVKITGDETQNVIYLTFPMGWEKAPNTETILNILSQKGVKALFYVTHEYAAKNPGIIQRIIAEGHEIGSHGYSHPTGGIANLSIVDQMQDALKMHQFMKDTYGYTMRKYNFNSSAWSHAGIATITTMGYQVCFYSYNYADYDVNNQVPVDQVLANMIGALFPGCVYYLHTVSDSNTQALSAFIDAARARGYEFGRF